MTTLDLSEIIEIDQGSTSKIIIDAKPSVVSDWRSEVNKETHRGSFFWEEPPPSKFTGRCKILTECQCIPRKAILKGKRMRIPKKIHIIEYLAKSLNKNKINPTATAVIFGEDTGDSVTFQQLDALSNAVANAFITGLPNIISNKNPDGDLIMAFSLPPSLQCVSIMCAILKLGAAYCPISLGLPEERLIQFVEQIKPILFVVSKHNENQDKYTKLLKSKEYAFTKFIILEDLWEEIDAAKWSVAPVETIDKTSDPEIIYPPLYQRPVAIFGGSSKVGLFRGVKYKSTAVFNMMNWEWKTFKMHTREKLLIQAEMDTVLSIVEIFGPLLYGNPIIITDPEESQNPLLLLKAIKKYGLIRINLYAGELACLMKAIELIGAEAGSILCDTLKYVFCVGGLLKLDLAESFFSFLKGRKFLINMYGDDDDLGAICYQVLDSLEHVQMLNHHGRIPVGCPMPNIRIYLVDDDMKIVHNEQIGEICVAGSVQLADPDIANPAHAKFVKNPFSRSKEFKHLLETGHYGKIVYGHYGTRVLILESSFAYERVAVIDSRHIELDEIEFHVNNIPLVTSCHASCYRSGHEDQVVVAFYTTDKPECTEEVEAELRKKLPAYMLPDLVEIEEMPEDFTGVINENYLLREYYNITMKRKDFQNWSAVLGERHKHHFHAVKVLFGSIWAMMGLSYQYLGSKMNEPFLNLPRASYTKGVFVAAALHQNRYPIPLIEFFRATSLSGIIQRMASARAKSGLFFMDSSVNKLEHKYKMDTMTDAHYDEVLEVLSYCLTANHSLDYYADVNRNDLKRFILCMWNIFSMKGLSRIITKGDGKIAAIIINCNWHDEINAKDVFTTREIGYRLQLMQILEFGVADTDIHPMEAACLQIIYAVVDPRQANQLETHSIMEKMIGETIRMAKGKGFEAVIFTTYDLFVTDICVNNFGFKVIRECKVNQFIAADGRRPYSFAPDHIVASLCIRPM